MQIRANTKAVNHWFLMLFIVLIFLYFIGYVLGLGTSKTAKKLNKLLAVFLCRKNFMPQKARIVQKKWRNNTSDAS